MNPDNPNFRDDNFCPDCKENFTTAELDIKMGGLICPKCRLILVAPSEPLWNNERLRRNEAAKKIIGDK